MDTVLQMINELSLKLHCILPHKSFWLYIALLNHFEDFTCSRVYLSSGSSLNIPFISSLKSSSSITGIWHSVALFFQNAALSLRNVLYPVIIILPSAFISSPKGSCFATITYSTTPAE